MKGVHHMELDTALEILNGLKDRIPPIRSYL